MRVLTNTDETQSQHANKNTETKKRQPATDLMDKEKIDFRHLNRGTRGRNKLKTE